MRSKFVKSFVSDENRGRIEWLMIGEPPQFKISCVTQVRFANGVLVLNIAREPDYRLISEQVYRLSWRRTSA